MGGIALMAKQMGYDVSGSDANVYPPMSEQLAAHGITLKEGYYPDDLQPDPDLVVVGNALSRGNAAIEYVLNTGLPYTSGPEFLTRYILPKRWVLAVAGTHGKTTTSSMLAWILEHAGLKPGFLIGGIATNFGVSARLGHEPFFVVEADEYDTAFFDKRSKFIHYHPRTLIINNIEFDHADIFIDLADIKRQFHHLVRTVPENGLILVPRGDEAVADVLKQGCWSATEFFRFDDGEDTWHADNSEADGSAFDVCLNGQNYGRVEWNQCGRHNINNALATVAAARHAGVAPHHAVDALCQFEGVKRRLELRGIVNNIHVYDDFAHHPTAIQTTLDGLRQRVGNEARIIVVLEPRSNTMRMGVHEHSLPAALDQADRIMLYQSPDSGWDMQTITGRLRPPAQIFNRVADIIEAVHREAGPGDHILIMSNGGFENIHDRLLKALAA